MTQQRIRKIRGYTACICRTQRVRGATSRIPNDWTDWVRSTSTHEELTEDTTSAIKDQI